MKHRPSGLLILLAVICAAAGVGDLKAATVRRLSFDELVSKAGAIIQGHVTAVNTAWSDDHKIILTSYTFAIDENIKGASGRQSMVVTTIGGQIGKTILHVSGMPAFEQGETAVVFVEQSGKYSTVVGLNQGKFSVRNGQVSNSTVGLDFAGGAAGTTLRMPIDEFKRQIRLRLNK